MQSRQSLNDQLRHAPNVAQSWVRTRRVPVAQGIATALVLAAIMGNSQQAPPPRTPHPILLPEANHLPDVNDQLKLNQQNSKKLNFEAANVERKRQIDDETTKLLILARDLKTKMDGLGGGPLPPVLVKEASVIEILANDVKIKMKMTVGGG
jgi:hypothetical protein